MALFVVAMNFRPADYWAMTGAERGAIIAAYNKANK